MIELTKHYPNIAYVLAGAINTWPDLSPDERNTWITEALDNIREGRAEIEVAAQYSRHGATQSVDLTAAYKNEVHDSAAAVERAAAHLRQLVVDGADALGITQVASVAGVTRPTVYRWIREAD